VPMEPLVPNKPVQKLITDESGSGTWQSDSQLTDAAVVSNVTVMMIAADESAVLLSSAVISILSTVATLFIATAIFCLVSSLCMHKLLLSSSQFDVCAFRRLLTSPKGH